MRWGPDGNLYVSSSFNNRVLRYNGSSGAFIDVFVSTGLSNAQGLAFHPNDGNLYVASFNGDSVLKYNGTTGALIGTFVSAGSGGLNAPTDIEFGPDGHLYVQSSQSVACVLRYDGITGTFSSSFTGSGGGQGYLLFVNSPVSDRPSVRKNGTGLVVLPTPVIVPFTAAAEKGSVRRMEDSALELRLDVIAPPGESLLSFDVAGARIELSNGFESRVLYEPGPEETGRSMSVFADLAVLFPRSAGATFLLTAQPGSEPSLLSEPRFHGGVALRNGSGANELALVSAGTPRAGEEWQAWVDISARPAVRASLVWVTENRLAGRASRHGELLVDLHGRVPFATSLVASNGGTDVHSFLIPPAALGCSFSLQALIVAEHGSVLTNAIDLVVGRSK
jgi:hypothetical protein